MKPISTVCSVCPPSGNGLQKSVSPLGKRFQVAENWFGRVPAEVLADPAVSDAAVRVYAILALQTFRGDLSSIGIRQLAKMTHHGPRAVMRYVRMLESARHIEPIKGTNGQRTQYRLLSPIFAGKVSQVQSESENPAAAPEAHKGKPLFECVKCHQITSGLMRGDLCRKCNAEARIRRIACEEIRKDRRATA